ncbi:hypothetical protein L228DRAFT_266024 [Xylona heveae TC161]|uniref:Uncharacterized protein n=1 Tax=Xylona heveae (strain CBS 132557 / TC161) TaxID=1328760 RepID=A0A165IYM3_XYLHT|nr:hypothetical protein L228DRAFT_266024 [Xylona heveae TC161]KZF25558.1 hypothetical protein L228DRAFT_266024 [Xylona heveae TC161]
MEAAVDKPKFTAAEMGQALTLLDAELSKSKNIQRVSPVKIISYGGFVGVTHLQSYPLTESIEYILDPAILDKEKIRVKLQRGVKAVAEKHTLPIDWMNSRVELLAVGDSIFPLFGESEQQNVALFRGKNIIVYAAEWKWSLAHKLKRYGSELKSVDLLDAVAITKVLVPEMKAEPLSRAWLRDLNKIVHTPIEEHVIDRVAYEFEQIHRYTGIS